MSPARTRDDGIDLNKLVRRVVLDIVLLHWFATKGGRGPRVVNAIMAARHEATNAEMPILHFLERYVGEHQ